MEWGRAGTGPLNELVSKSSGKSSFVGPNCRLGWGRVGCCKYMKRGRAGLREALLRHTRYKVMLVFFYVAGLVGD